MLIALFSLGFAAALIVLVMTSSTILVKVRRIARGFGISEIAITLLGLSILASLPEFFVSIFAAIRDSSDVSLGVVIGSNLFTLLVVLGLAAMIRPFHVKMVIEERDGTWMLLGSCILLVLAPAGINRWQGIILVLLYLPYIYSVYRKEKDRLSQEKQPKHNPKFRRSTELLKLIALVAVMLGSAELVVRSGLKLATLLHTPEIIISLILIGIGASIPETAIGVLSALKRKTDITLGDVYGTNIFTVFFILGVSAIISPISVTSDVLTFILPYFILSTIILQLFFTTGHRVGRIEGVTLILLYVYFVLAEFNFLPKP